MQVTAIQPNCSSALHPRYKTCRDHAMRLLTRYLTGESKERKSPRSSARSSSKAMELQKLLPILLLAILCAGPVHAMRLLNDVDGGREFSFGTKAAAAGAETEPLDPSLNDDYENEISHVEFEPVLGSAAPYAAAAAPVPAATATVTIATAAAAAAGPVSEPVRVRNAAAAAAAGAAGTRSMKWWLPPSTMPSFPLFPNPGGMPGMPGIPGLPMPGMPFHPIGGGWGVPAPPDQAPPAPPAGAASTNANDPNANGGIN